jgi:hypothetical protein
MGYEKVRTHLEVLLQAKVDGDDAASMALDAFFAALSWRAVGWTRATDGAVVGEAINDNG